MLGLSKTVLGLTGAMLIIVGAGVLANKILNDKYDKGAKDKETTIDLAITKKINEGRKNEKDIKKTVNAIPDNKLNKLFKQSFPVTAKDSTVMSTMGTFGDDTSGQRTSFTNESSAEEKFNQQQTSKGEMDGNVRKPCPTVIVWDDILDMYIPVECD